MNWAALQKANPPLPKAEQIALARKAQAGDAKARDKLVLSCVGLCLKMAHRYRHIASFDDVVQAGMEGALRGLKTFEPQRGLMFTNHAWHWIKRWTYHSVSRADQIVSDWKQIRLGKLVTTKHESLDEPIYTNRGTGAETTRLDRLLSLSEPAATTCERAELAAKVRARVARAVMTPFARDILNARLVDCAETLKTVGERHGFSREWARQVEKGLITELRRALADLADAA